MDSKQIIDIFKRYEEKFGEWLYTAWDFSSVDWQGLATEAEKCIKQNKPLSEQTRQRFAEHFDKDKLY